MDSLRDVPENVLLAIIGAASAALGAIGRPILDTILGRRNRYREEFAEDIAYMRQEIDKLREEVSNLQDRIREKDALIAKRDEEVAKWRDQFYSENRLRSTAEHERDMSRLRHDQILSRLRAQGLLDDDIGSGFTP